MTNANFNCIVELYFCQYLKGKVIIMNKSIKEVKRIWCVERETDDSYEDVFRGTIRECFDFLQNNSIESLHYFDYTKKGGCVEIVLGKNFGKIKRVVVEREVYVKENEKWELDGKDIGFHVGITEKAVESIEKSEIEEFGCVQGSFDITELKIFD